MHSFGNSGTKYVLRRLERSGVNFHFYVSVKPNDIRFIFHERRANSSSMSRAIVFLPCLEIPFTIDYIPVYSQLGLTPSL